MLGLAQLLAALVEGPVIPAHPLSGPVDIQYKAKMELRAYEGNIKAASVDIREAAPFVFTN